MAENQGFQTLPLRLLIDKQECRILYAESDKRFVDLIFWFLRIPAASIVELLSTLGDVGPEVGSLTNVYRSVEKLPRELWLSADCSTELMHPKLQASINASPKEALLKVEAPRQPQPRIPSFYYCYKFCRKNSDIHTVSSVHGSLCFCGEVRRVCIDVEDSIVKPGATSSSSISMSGYVKDTVTFMITDDLQVAPASTIASIALLNKLNLTNLSQLEERSVSVGFTEAVQLLRAMLVSKTPLNDVFGGTEKLSSKATSSAGTSAAPRSDTK